MFLTLTVVGLAVSSVVLIALGATSLINPTWLGFKSRKIASLIYQGSAALLLISSLLLSNHLPSNTNNIINIQEHMTLELNDIPEFNSMTSVQRAAWNEVHAGRYSIQDSCTVSNVSPVGWFSEFDTEGFEVTCKPDGTTHKVLGLSNQAVEEIRQLNLNDVIQFQGILIQVKYWGLWTTAYIDVQSLN